MINTNSYKKHLDKILQSDEFSSSKTYQSYLTYLAEAAASGKELKEITIAMEFFEKDASFNPAEDTIVRSHTYNLRKKLETYYLKEGSEDKYILQIPKGHYEVRFIPVSEVNLYSKSLFDRLIKNKVYFSIIALLFACVVYLLSQNFSLRNQREKFEIIDTNDPIWNDYLQSKLPILIAIGNHFFFTEYSTNYENLLAIRDGNINTLEDLRNFNAKHPDRRIQQADEPYFPYHSIWSLPPILSLLNSSNQKPILRRASLVTAQMLDEYNIIYIGSIKTLYILRHIISVSHFRFEISPHKIEYSLADSDATQQFKTSLHSPGPNEDLVLALKLPGPADNSILIICSYHSLGAPEVANFFVNPDTRIDLEKKFEQKFNRMPEYFEILFRVTGIDKTAYNTEILIFNEIVK
jgi:hypothetical protein